MNDVDAWNTIHSYQLSPEEIISRVADICRRHGAAELILFGSYAAGSPTSTSDMDFAVKGCPDMALLDEEVQEIPTLKKIDLLDYDGIRNLNLKRDIDTYGKKIYGTV